MNILSRKERQKKNTIADVTAFLAKILTKLCLPCVHADQFVRLIADFIVIFSAVKSFFIRTGVLTCTTE